MQKRPFTFYTSTPATGGLKSVADLLSQQQPVILSDISDMRQPDLQRPTRQQLRTEQVDVNRELEAARRLIRLAEPHPRLAGEVSTLKQQATKYQVRLEQINQMLGEGGVKS